jgi:hypothetical protein
MFKKNQKNSGDGDLLAALDRLKEKIVSNYEGVTINDEWVTSATVADAISRVAFAAVKVDSVELREFATSAGTLPCKEIMGKTVPEKAFLLFHVTADGAELRQWCSENNLGHLNVDLTLIGMAFYSYLEACDDFQDVLTELMNRFKQ